VREGETGVLVDPYDPAAVAAAVIALLDDAALRRRLGEGGRRAVETYYNWDRVVRDLAAIDAELRYTSV
jgi:glycosyltransferase involved in cell wall biosynthesis